jgi:hypothetical protein
VAYESCFRREQHLSTALCRFRDRLKQIASLRLHFASRFDKGGLVRGICLSLIVRKPESSMKRRACHDNPETISVVREFDAVIGIGGIRPWPKYNAIAGKLTWVGIGAHKIFDDTEIGEACPMPDTFKGGSDGSGQSSRPCAVRA